MEFTGKNTRVGCQFLLQGIFPTQGWNLNLLCLLYWQVDSSPPCHLGSAIRITSKACWNVRHWAPSSGFLTQQVSAEAKSLLLNTFPGDSDAACVRTTLNHKPSTASLAWAAKASERPLLRRCLPGGSWVSMAQPCCPHLLSPRRSQEEMQVSQPRLLSWHNPPCCPCDDLRLWSASPWLVTIF